MYAVIKTGGKQVKVSDGAIIEVEKSSGAVSPGDSFTFSDVLLMADGDQLSLGTPLVENANVFGTVLDVLRAPKVLIFKKKRRKQYRRTKGHRQYLMRVRIDEMGLYPERKKQPEARPAVAASPRAPKPKTAAGRKTAKPAAKTAKTGKAGKAAAPKSRAAAGRKAAPAASGRSAKKPAKTPDSKSKKKR